MKQVFLLVLFLNVISSCKSQIHASKSLATTDKIVYYINDKINSLINKCIDSEKQDINLYYIVIDKNPSRGSYTVHVEIDEFNKYHYEDSIGNILYMESYLKRNSNRVLNTGKYLLPVIIEEYDMVFGYFGSEYNYQGMRMAVLRHGFSIEFNKDSIIRFGW